MGGARGKETGALARAVSCVTAVAHVREVQMSSSSCSPFSHRENDNVDDEFADSENENTSEEDDDAFFEVNFKSSVQAGPSSSKAHVGSPPPSTLSQSLTFSPSPKLTPLKQQEEMSQVLSRKRETVSYTKLFSFAKNKTEQIEELQILQDKTVGLMEQGGIMNMAKRLQSLPDEETDPGTPNSAISSGVFGRRESVTTDIDKTATPGMAVFVHPPRLMDTLTAPVLVDQCSSIHSTLFESNPATLREAVLGKWIYLLYSTMPCPVEVANWLLDVTCLCSDAALRESAFLSLNHLLLRPLQCSPQSVHPVSYESIFTIFTKLGASQEVMDSSVHLLDSRNGSVSCDITENSAEIVSEAVKRIFTLVTAGASTVSPRLYSLGGLQELILLLVKVSLDSYICRRGVSFSLSECLDCLLDPLSESEKGSVSDWLIHLAPSVFNDHRNQLYIVEIFSFACPNLRPIQRQLLRTFLSRAIIVYEEEEDEQMEDDSQPVTPDDQLALNVLNYYHRLQRDEIDYVQLHSVTKMLSIFIFSPKMVWSDPLPSKEHLSMREKFLGQLSYLCSVRVKDSVHDLMRGQVKDLLIRTQDGVAVPERVW